MKRPGVPTAGHGTDFHTHPDFRGRGKMTAGLCPRSSAGKFDASGLETRSLLNRGNFNKDGSMLTLHLRKGG